MGLGAFIAGLLLAETEYRREIEVTIEPFKAGLLLGLFFVAIGAGLDFSEVAHHPLVTVGLAAAFIAVKIVVMFLSARAMKLPWRVATESALMLAPGGEFAFVLVGRGDRRQGGRPRGGLERPRSRSRSRCSRCRRWPGRRGRLTRRMPSADRHLTVVPKAEEGGAKPRALLIGYGRVGQLIAEMLRKHEITFLAVDEAVATVRAFRRQGVPITYGKRQPDRVPRALRVGECRHDHHHARQRRRRRGDRAAGAREAAECDDRRPRPRRRPCRAALRAGRHRRGAGDGSRRACSSPRRC